MSQQNDYAPVRQPPPLPPRQPAGVPRWVSLVLGLVAVGIVVIAGLANLLEWYSKGAQKTYLPAAGVKLGQPLAWRELVQHGNLLRTMTYNEGGLFADDFDADGDGEILRIVPKGEAYLCEVDGTVSRVPISGLHYLTSGVSWDYDRDGVAEILIAELRNETMKSATLGEGSSEDFLESQTMPVFGLSGEVVAELPAVGMKPGSLLTADIDGDGYAELLASKLGPCVRWGSYTTWVAFGQDGCSAGELVVNERDRLDVTGDVDGDGRDELICLTTEFEALYAYGIGQDRTETCDWDLLTLGVPHGCSDLTGDGVAEIISPTQGFYNPADETFTAFQLPAGVEAFQLLGQAVTGDFDSDGELEVAHGGLLDSFVLITQTSGRCEYYEEFGEIVFAIITCHAGGSDYLVVQLQDRLLIYP